jgi:glycosyltransferase involved in cell wall biosynthesis
LRISFSNGCGAPQTGHGYVTMRLLKTINETKHKIYIDRDADLEFNFTHPNFYKFSENTDSVKVGYVAWESTDLQEGWKDIINSKCDELWVPNKFTQDVFQNYFDREVFIFPHGVDERFVPKKRSLQGPMKFLHIGYPALRKNLPDVTKAFLELYKGNMDYHLTVKTYEGADYDPGEPNITVIARDMTYSNLVNLMHEHHVLLYPSWGEGFGLIPLQAIATGMPVISTEEWCDYKEFNLGLGIGSELVRSPWQKWHPGKMYKPLYWDFVGMIEYVVANYESLASKQFELAPMVHEKYNWNRVVSKHFNNVESRLML